MPSPKERIQETLYRSSLFADLEDPELDKLADEYRLYFPARGERVIEQDDKADRFYLIHRGSVELLWSDGREEISMAVLEPGDYFGEEGLMRQRTYQVSAEAGQATALIEISAAQYKRLVKDHPEVKQTLQMVAETQEMAQKMRFNWLGEDENVYIIARRHGFILFARMLGPLVFWLVAGLLAFWGWLSALSLPWLLAGVSLLTGILWGIWVVLDWRNDYYILTNDRIVWLEKVIALYENRQEAPLYTILSTDITSSQLGRIVGYGDVTVKTFTGEILLGQIGNPQRVVDLIEEHRQRSAEQEKIESMGAIRQTVRQHIGLERRKPAGPPSRKWRKKKEVKFKMPPIWRDFVHMRLEQGDTITYRKHWLILSFRIWFPLLVLVGVIYLISLQFLSLFIDVVLLLIALFWVWYQYADWRNDIFQVSKDKIFDIDRKPLGTEQRKEASLANILSLEVRRIGLIGMLFNYGDVIIDVGGTNFVFDTIFDPVRAQQDIFRRIDEMKQRKRSQEDEKERSRLAEWFEIYDDEAQNPYNWEDIGY